MICWMSCSSFDCPGLLVRVGGVAEEAVEGLVREHPAPEQGLENGVVEVCTE